MDYTTMKNNNQEDPYVSNFLKSFKQDKLINSKQVAKNDHEDPYVSNFLKSFKQDKLINAKLADNCQNSTNKNTQFIPLVNASY